MLPRISGSGEYRCEIRFDPELSVPPAPEPLRVQLSLAMDAHQAAAYHEWGQRLRGKAALRNHGAAAAELRLSAVTSHFG